MVYRWTADNVIDLEHVTMIETPKNLQRLGEKKMSVLKQRWLVKFITESHFLQGFIHIFCCVMELQRLLILCKEINVVWARRLQHPPTMKADIICPRVQEIYIS